MTLFRYHAAFDVSTLGLGNVNVATSGHTTIHVNMSALVGQMYDGGYSSIFFNHHNNGNQYVIVGKDPAATPRLTNYSEDGFLLALTRALAAAAVAASWGGTASNLRVEPDGTVGHNVFIWDASITVTFDTSDGARLLGFTTLAPASGTTVTGLGIPYYTILPIMQGGTMLASTDYEPEAIGNHIVADDGGGGTGISRTVSPLYRDWIQQYELRERAERPFAVSTHQFTFQHLFEHCRGQWPFIVDQGFAPSSPAEVFFLRTEGIPWHPERTGPDKLNDPTRHISFKTIVEGAVADAPQ